VQIASDPLNDLKVPAVGLKPKFHWELRNNSRLFSATAFQRRFSNCHFSLLAGGNGCTLLSTGNSKFVQFHAAQTSVFRWSFDFIGVSKSLGVNT